MHIRIYNRGGGFLLLAVLLLVSNGGSGRAWAARRASPEEIQKLAKEQGEQLLADPVANYEKISALLVRPQTSSRSNLLNTLSIRLSETAIPEEKAAFLYLMGEAHYWGAMADFKKTHSPKAFDGAAEKVLPYFLDAWGLVQKPKDIAKAASLRAGISAKLKHFPTTSLYGSQLSTKLKNEMVTRFIDVLESQEDGPDSWPLDLRAQVYGNLGIGHRLDPKLPKGMPGTYEDTVKAMRLAWRLKSTTNALHFAYELEDQYADRLQGDLRTHHEVYEVYRDTRDQRALPCLKAIAKKDTNGYLELYSLSREREPNLSLKKRKEYLEAYLNSAASKATPQVKYFEAIARQCMRSADYSTALEYIARGLLQSSDAGSDNNDLRLLYARAICLEKMGEREMAQEGYQRCLSRSREVPDAESMMDMCEQGLLRLGSSERGGGEQ